MRLPTRLCTVACVAIAIATTAFKSALAEGAFAFGQFGNGGWVVGGTTNARTKAEAQNAAMQQCNARGPNCQLRTTFTKTCFAYAVQVGAHSGAAWQEHPNLAAAQGMALAQCQKYGLTCTVQGSYCDSLNEDEVRAAEEQMRDEAIARQQAAQEAGRERANEYQKYVGSSRRCFEDPNAAIDAYVACVAALNYGNLTISDRAKLVERRDVVSNNLVKQKQQRDFQADYDACTIRFDEKRCARAQESPLSGVTESIMLTTYQTIALMFTENVDACHQGSALSCDRALKGPPVLVNPRKAELEKARDSATLVQKAWASIVSMGETVAKPFKDILPFVSEGEAIPTSTIIAGSMSAVLALSLGFMVLKQRRNVSPFVLPDSIVEYFSPKTQNIPLPKKVKGTAVPEEKASEPSIESAKFKEEAISVSATGPTSGTAYILNLLLPGAGNVYFGQPVIGTIFILGILLSLFMLLLGGSAAMLGVVIIVASIITAFFTFGLTLIVGLPVGFLFLMMGAGPILAFFIWIFSLIVSEVLVHSKAKKLAGATAV